MRLVRVSPLGEWAGPLSILAQLTAIKPIAKALTQSKMWLPANLRSGRNIQEVRRPTDIDVKCGWVGFAN